MVGRVGSLHALPGPNSKAVGEAVNLLTFLGSGSEAGKKLLAEMREVQENNESVLKEAQSAISEARQIQEEIGRGRASLDQDIRAHNENHRQITADLIKARSKLEADKGAFEVERKRLSEALAVRATEVGRREEKVSDLEADLSGRKSEIETMENVIKKKEAELNIRKQDLDDKYRRIRAAIE